MIKKNANERMCFVVAGYHYCLLLLLLFLGDAPASVMEINWIHIATAIHLAHISRCMFAVHRFIIKSTHGHTVNQFWFFVFFSTDNLILIESNRKKQNRREKTSTSMTNWEHRKKLIDLLTWFLIYDQNNVWTIKIFCFKQMNCVNKWVKFWNLWWEFFLGNN